MKPRTTVQAPRRLPSDVADTYDAFKEFEGKRYTGMRVGRSHKWYYDKGEWKETKVTPDEWAIDYHVTKRRAGKAPEGSGVPVGTGYHWYILAHQNVTKLNANDYSTSLTGMKIKLAHRRAENEKWSASENAQRKHLIRVLQRMIHDLEAQVAEAPARSATNGAAVHRNGAARGRAAATAKRSKPAARTKPAARAKRTARTTHTRAA
jgi:hypothetical protein